jgi:hypothetical protein
MTQELTGRTQSIIDSQGGGSTSEDLSNMVDPAKRVAETRQAAVEANAAQNLKIFRDQAQGEMKALSARYADQVMAKMHIEDLNPTDSRKYIGQLTERISELQKLVKGIDKSGTGNVVAKNTYAQVIRLLQDRVNGLQNNLIGAPTESAAASQPALQDRSEKLTGPAATPPSSVPDTRLAPSTKFLRAARGG